MADKKIRFAEFELDFGRFQLYRHGSTVRLEGLPLQLLMFLIENRGQLTDNDVSAFLQADFEREHLLEVIAVVAASTITNYAGKITNPPLEPLIKEHTWRG